MKLQHVAARCCLYPLVESTAEVYLIVLEEGLCIFPREKALSVFFCGGFVYFSSDEVAVVGLLVLLLSPPWQYIRPCCSDTLLYVLLLLLLLLHSHRVLLLISELFLPRLSPLGTEYAAAHR